MKTHWKKNFDYNYLGAYSLVDNQEVVLTIKSIKKESVKTSNGSKEDCTVATFLEAVNGENKPMIFNKTNCKVIEKLYKSPYIEDWINKKIKIYVEPNVAAFGDYVDALRIRPEIPIDKPILTKNHRRFEDAKKAWKSGKIDGVKKQFVISPEIEKILEQ